MNSYQRTAELEQAKAYVKDMLPASWNFPAHTNIEFDLSLQMVTGQHWHRSEVGYLL